MGRHGIYWNRISIHWEKKFKKIIKSMLVPVRICKNKPFGRTGRGLVDPSSCYQTYSPDQSTIEMWALFGERFTAFLREWNAAEGIAAPVLRRMGEQESWYSVTRGSWSGKCHRCSGICHTTTRRPERTTLVNAPLCLSPVW